MLIGDQQALGTVAPQGLGMVEIDLDHQYAERAFRVTDGRREEVAALARGVAQSEKASQAALHGFAEVRAEGEVAFDEGVFRRPVGGSQGATIRRHQVDHIRAGLPLQSGQQTVGLVSPCRILGRQQGRTEHRQLAEDGRQHFETTQRAQQVGDIQVERLAILLGQLLAVMALNHSLQRPQQRRQQQGQQQQATPAQARR